MLNTVYCPSIRDNHVYHLFDIEPYYRAYIARIDLSGGLSVCYLRKQSFVEVS